MSEIDLEQIVFPLDEFGYVRQTINYKQKELYLKSTQTYIKNSKRYRKSSFHCERVIGFDTETYFGVCKLLSRSEGKERDIYNPTFEECLNFMFYGARESNCYRLFYNLGFDITAILKIYDNTLFIDEENEIQSNLPEIIDLLNGKTIELFGYKITYLRGKLFSLRKHKKVVHFTDLWQFYQTSLDNAGMAYLGKRKYDKVDSARLNEDLCYWYTHLDEIRKYCKLDSELLAELGYKLIENVKELGIALPRYLCSSASFSKAHFMKECYIPSITSIPHSILEIAHHTYMGGRFEVFEQGYFDFLESYDINSQYPTMIKKLPSFKYGVWKLTDSIPKTETFGFYYAKLDIPKTCLRPTIPVKINNIITFPIGTIEGWYTWYDLDLVRKYIDYDYGIKGVEFHEGVSEYHTFEKEIDNLFNRKAIFKSQILAIEKQYPITNELYKYKEVPKELPLEILQKYQQLRIKYMILKLTQNALYGCFVETNTNSEGKTYGGRLFNPVNATFITAFGRWSVLKDIKHEDYPHIKAIHTDSVIMDKPIDYLSIDESLGSWTKEHSGKGFIMACGQYQIGKKIATRSYNKKQIGSWFTMLEKHKDSEKVMYTIDRMMKISECIIQRKSLDLANIMKEEQKEICLNADKKRIWKHKYSTFGQMLGLRNTSTPFKVFKKLNQTMYIFAS